VTPEDLERALLATVREREAIRLPELTRVVSEEAPIELRGDVVRRGKCLALHMIDRGVLLVGDDYKIRLRH